ncbi:MAG: hypothetical protein IT405_00080, partial [Candidatus Yanofskybacteria bacterium]|nr:hypothetical protein [Candidatus Yanofskybacteria bacterium]
MTTRSQHSLRLAAPLLWISAAIVAIAAIVEGVWELAQGAARPSSSFLATLGDGLDVFAVKLEGIPQFFASFGSTHANNLTVAAIFTSIVSCTIALRQISLWIRRPADIIHASRYAAHRTRRMLASADRYEHWGHVVDVISGTPIAFAAVHLLDRHGGTVAHTISDSEGRFGFSAPRASLADAGESVSLFVRKAGWTHTATVQEGRGAMMTASGSGTAGTSISSALGVLGRLAFWGQVGIVPLAFSLYGGPLLTAAVVSLPICALVYALGRRSALHVRVAGKPLVVAVSAVLFLTLGATAGSLTPSALPASTMHSLSEVYASIASAAFDSSAITANQNGSLIAQLKYMNNQLAWASSST